MAVPFDHPNSRLDKNLNKRDRDEIRQRLAMGLELKDQLNERFGRKSSLQSRLQNGMKLQICFMNETACEMERQNSNYSTEDMHCNSRLSEGEMTLSDEVKPLPFKAPVPNRTAMTGLQDTQRLFTFPENFANQQARLQREVRTALQQAKEMARLQIKLEREHRKKSPISEMVRVSLEKAGVVFPPDRRRMNRRILSELNVAQLQVVVNDLHSQIEALNKDLVDVLMMRDDLHMEQDSMLVDIEDLSRYICSYYAKLSQVS